MTRERFPYSEPDPSYRDRRRQPDRLLRLKAVISRTGMPISTIYRRELAGRFPRRLRIGVRAVAWYESEIEEFIANPMAYRPSNSPARIELRGYLPPSQA